ncbi:MAG TPA: PA14 domain-containing protein [Myxococcales bacterium]|nr:PA14 domain-containing protein [Myxococcales bacterium]
MWEKARREALVLSAYAALALILTWPLAARFGTEIGGDFGDHWQTLWGMWWVHKALVELHQNPFFSTYVHWPTGVPMFFETLDFPDCLLALPLWHFLPPVAVFNCAEAWSYLLGGWFFYHFALELTGHRPAAFAAGALFTFAPYHFGHALGHMHVMALEWVPLYFWMLLRTIERPERRWPVFAALALAAASLASWYYLLFCVALTFPYLAWRAATEPALRSWTALNRALILGAAYLAVMWPLFSAMLAARAADNWEGAHDPVTFSADLWSFFIPNAAQAIGAGFRSSWSRFSGNPAENCDYLGYALMALAALGAIKARRARVWIGLALLGVVLALGPYLRTGGVVHQGFLLPYGWLTRAAPLLDFTGCPVRAGFIAIFSLCGAAAFGLAWLFREGPSRPARWGAAAALLAVALVELWPHPFTTSRFPAPAIFASWAKDPSTFAVLDMSGDTRPLYDAVLHGHPLVDAYLSRTPERLIRWLDEQPVIGRLRHPRGGLGPPHQRRDPDIDFDWGTGSPMAGLGPDDFEVDWQGKLLVPAAGRYTLTLGADDAGVLFIDGRPVLTNGGTHPYLERSVTLPLAAGAHALAVSYRENEGGASVRLLWAREGEAAKVVPPEALLGPDGQPGLEGVYRQVGDTTGLSREAALDSLRKYRIRYLVMPSWRQEPLIEGELGLSPIYVGEGLRIYEVPAA